MRFKCQRDLGGWFIKQGCAGSSHNRFWFSPVRCCCIGYFLHGLTSVLRQEVLSLEESAACMLPVRMDDVDAGLQGGSSVMGCARADELPCQLVSSSRFHGFVA